MTTIAPSPSAPQQRRAWLRTAGSTAAAAALTLALAGCAAPGFNSLSADVSSFGEWPAGRKPGTYAFERLPSQQARAAESELLEQAARDALAKAGFVPAAQGLEPDVLVQLGMRVGRTGTHIWDDPLWWRGGFGRYRYGPWMGPRWGLGLHYDLSGRYEHQVAVLLRDRASGKPVYESRASRESATELTSRQTLAAMFEAALMDFPKPGLNPRTVTVPLPGRL